MRFEWDDLKNKANLKKHGISFELAALAFNDERQLVVGPYLQNGETRYNLLASLGLDIIVIVVYTSRGRGNRQIIRIISARKATTSERREYDGF